MKYTSFLALVERYFQCPQIAEDRHLFEKEMEAALSSDEKGYAALLAAVGAPEIMAIERPLPSRILSEEQRTQNMQAAWRLYTRLTGEGHGTYAALWAANCWGNALAWPLCLTDEGYLEWVQALPSEKMQELAEHGDGYAAAALARLCEQNGDVQGAACWYKAAFDCCDVLTMRWLEQLAQGSGMTQEGYEALTARHASLGDPEGMAAHALYLLGQGTEPYAEKALALALYSADMHSPAGQYALYRCLSEAKAISTGQEFTQESERSIRRNAVQQLDMAAEGGYPLACLERGMRRNAAGAFDSAYEDLLMAATDTSGYAAVWDGAYLLARYFLEGKGGAGQSESQAYMWAQRGAQHGSAAAMGMCGAMQMMGLGTQQDLHAGAEQIAAAAQMGDLDSMHRISLMHRFDVRAAKDYAADEYAARCTEMGEESADGLGFDWIERLEKGSDEVLQPEEKAEPTVSNADESEDKGMPEAADGFKIGADSEYMAEQETWMDPADEDESEETIESNFNEQTYSMLELFWPCISGVLGSVDQEMINATGEPAPDAALVDVLLACLCGAMAICGSDEQRKEAYESLISAFDSLMPGFAENGFDEAYLHEEFAAISEAMNSYRAGYEELFAQQGKADEDLWMHKCEIECASAYEIIGQVIQPDASAQERIRAAVRRMLLEMKTALSNA